MSVATYRLDVAWDDSPTYAGAGDDVTARVLPDRGLTCARGKDQIRSLSPPMAGSLEVGLDNRSKDYSPEYAGVLVNLILNPSFEVDTAGWSFDAGTLVRSTAGGGQFSGVAGGLLTAPVGGGTLTLYPTVRLAVTAGLAYTHSAYVLDAVTLRAHRCDIQWFDVALALLSTTVGAATSPSGWSRRVVTGVAPASAVWARPIVYTLATAAGETFYHDAIQFEQNDHATDYVDGSLYNNRWSGTAHNSASIRGGGLQAAGDLVPGHRVRLRATFASVTYDLFTGTLDDLPQHPELGYRAVDLPCLGSLSRLKGLKVATALYAGIRTDQALGYLLDAAGWPAGDRVLSTGRTTLLYWWCDDVDAFDMAVTLLNTEGPGASLYEDGSGRIVFEDRHYRLLTSRCTTSQATIRDSGAEPHHTVPFAYNPGLKDVIGSAVVSVNARTHVDAAVVWQLGTTLSLGASEARAFRVKSADPLAGVAAPVAGTDYTLTAGSVASATLDRTSGTVVTLTITAGAGGATLTGLQLRGEKYTATSSQIKNRVAGSTIPGAKDYTLALWPEIHPNQAQDLCDLIVTAYRDPRPTVSLTLEGASATMLTHLLAREVSDRVTVVEAQTGLNAACFVERIARQVDLAGSRHRATLGCEKVTAGAYPSNPVIIDGTAGQGIDSSATIIY